MLHIDIPTRANIERLAALREPVSVSLYLPTSPLPSETEVDRLELRRLAEEALEQLRASDAKKGDIDLLVSQIDDLHDDVGFWQHQSHSLAVFVTPKTLTTFRLPNRLTSAVEVSDRFYIKPLLRAVTFPQAAYVIAMSQNTARLVQVSSDAEPETIWVPGQADRAAEAAGLDSAPPLRKPEGANASPEGLRQYARAIDRAIRPIITGQHLPLIIAGNEPLTGNFRTVCSYPNLAEDEIVGSPEEYTYAEIATAAREILDKLYAAELAELKDDLASRAAHGRAFTDLADVARAATFGAVQTLLFDMDHVVSGYIDEVTGEVTLDEGDDAVNYGVIDEIVRRSLLSGAKIFAVRADDVPGGGAVAANIRFAV